MWLFDVHYIYRENLLSGENSKPIRWSTWSEVGPALEAATVNIKGRYIIYNSEERKREKGLRSSGSPVFSGLRATSEGSVE